MSNIERALNLLNFFIDNKKTFLWGASYFIEELLNQQTTKNENIIGIIDKNPKKHGQICGQYKIYSPEILEHYSDVNIIVTILSNNDNIYNNIKDELKEKYPFVKLLPNIILEINNEYSPLYNSWNNIYRHWLFKGSDEELFKLINDIDFTENKNTATFKIWLMYISALYETNQKSLAINILKDYVKKFGLQNIENYLLVAKLAKENNYINEKILKACIIYDKFQNNMQQNLLETFIKNKTVAIVGNGPSEVNKGLGKEIDSHDIVIRINNYSIQGYERDYGSKTNIWVKCSSDDIKHEIRDDRIKLIIYEPDYMHHEMLDSYIQECYQSPLPMIYLNLEEHRNLRDKLKIFPSTGLLLIEKVLNIETKKVDFYGFSFKQEKLDNYFSHYFQAHSVEEQKVRCAHHNLIVETEYLINKLSIK